MRARHLFMDLIVYGVGGIASRFVGLLLVPIYTRMLTPADYGLLDILMTVMAVLGLLSGLQVESGVARDFYDARDRGQLRALIGTGLWLCAAGVLVVTVAAMIIFYGWFHGCTRISWWEMAPVLCSLLPTRWLGMLLILLQFEKRPVAYSVVALGDVILTAVLGLLAVCLFHWGVRGILWAALVSKVLWSIGVAWICYRPYVFGWNGLRARSIMAYSVPIVPNVLISWIQNYGNRFILVSTLSLASVGVFSLATSVASILMVLIMAFRMAWDPMATELMGREESRGIYARVFDYYMLFAALACAMLGSLGHLLVRLLAPPDYAAAGPLVTSLCMGYLWVGSLQIVALGINVVRKTYLGVVGYTVGLAVNMGLLWVCVRQEGLPAAGMTFLLGSIATGLVMYGISQRFFRVPYNRVLLLNMILFSVGLSLVFLRWDTWAPEPSSLVAQTSCRVAFALVTWCVVALVSLRREDRARLAQFVQGALVNHRYEF